MCHKFKVFCYNTLPQRAKTAKKPRNPPFFRVFIPKNPQKPQKSAIFCKFGWNRADFIKNAPKRIQAAKQQYKHPTGKSYE